ncbi:MAG: gephyrin-like molybdotransferase Glp [Candidatus Aerophobetes bacterium]|nr:gephyrin-like molybdotransferase Glp [Candidatus Aerophobetes bacterium]
MISLKKALDIVLNEVNRLGPLSKEKVDLLSSFSRVLAEDIQADFNTPPFDRAAMDGYAVISEDTLKASPENPAILKVMGDLPAGSKADFTLSKEEAIRIMTGAPMPSEADAVVMVEDTQMLSNKDEVKIFKEVSPGENVSFRGEDVKEGEFILSKGRFIGAVEVGMLASLGKREVFVRERPRVSIIVTGEEIVEPGKRLPEGKIYNSNSYALFCQALSCGALPKNLGIAGDEKEKILSKVEEGLKSDILILSGGVSVGKYDLVKETLEDTGIKRLFWKVAVKPGKPTFFGVKEKTLIFGLPGYPVSSILNFENLIKPAIFFRLGRKDWNRLRIKAHLKEDIKNRSGRENFIRVKMIKEKGEWWAVPVSSQKSGVIKSLIQADGLIIVPREEKMGAGEKVEVEVLRGQGIE